jgi:hypothetical protein
MSGTDPEALTAPGGLVEWSSFMGVKACHPGRFSEVVLTTTIPAAGARSTGQPESFWRGD